MCGIAALFSKNDQKIDETTLYQMIVAMNYRGDSDQTPKVNNIGRAGLACVRLPIVGRETGQQPFGDTEQEVLVVFNGEIYNHSELRAELESCGFKFQSDCDTEVLVHGYKKWSTELPARLRGMYAFVIFDRATGDFFAARDPFGIKPLYYGQTESQVGFSSQIYPLTRSKFKNIREVPPGGYVNNKTESVRELFPVVSPARIDSETAIRRLRELIRESLRRHLDTDLDVAVLVSGGIDSSVLLYEAAQIIPGRVKAYCVGTKDSSDMQYARILIEYMQAKGMKVELHQVNITLEQMLESIRRTIFVIESFEPNHIRAGTTNLALASQVKKDGIRIAICGEGADELLGGYEEYPQAVRDNQSEEKIQGLFDRFVRELHKTQLQRVDRTNMYYGIEARVPYLDHDLSRFILSLPIDLKVHKNGRGVTSKYILREAYKGLLPDSIVKRRKVPMGEGAGVGDNRRDGPFYQYTDGLVSDEELSEIQKTFPQFKIQNKEEAYYFSLYKSRFSALELACQRPLTNILKTK
jgi:asparagine synthase (glutamine-hydrolysing)